jgi:hypothetical protein
MIVELLTIVSLKTRDGTMELSLNKSMKRNKCGKNVRLVPQWKGPDIVSEVIENNKIILEP